MALGDGNFVLTAEDRTAAAFNSVKGRLDSVASAMLSFSGILAGSVGSLTYLAKQSINSADELSKLSQKVGISTEKLSAYGYAAKLSGTDIDGMAMGIQKLNISISKAGDGQKEAVEAFARLGISVRDASGKLKDNDAILLEVADRFKELPDGAQKTAAAVALLGKSGANLIPFLNNGSEGLKQLTDEARRFGLVVSSDTARAAEQFNDNLDRLKFGVFGVVRSITAEMLPALTNATNGMLEAGGPIDKLRNSLDAIATIAKIVGAVLMARVVSSIYATSAAFIAGQIEAVRYQAALARMAGAGGVAAGSMGLLAAGGSRLLGLLGGPVGFAVTLGLVGLQFVKFSDNAKIANMSTEDFDKNIAQLTGNTEKLADASKKVALGNIMSQMQAVGDEIFKIQDEAQRSNSKLGKSEEERIQLLQERLAKLGQAYQDVANKKEAAAAASELPGPKDDEAARELAARKDRDAKMAEQLQNSLKGRLDTIIQANRSELDALKAKQDDEEGDLFLAWANNLASEEGYQKELTAMRARHIEERQKLDADAKASADLKQRLQERLDVIRQANTSELDLLAQKHQKQQADIRASVGLIGLDQSQADALMLQNEQLYQDQKAAIQQAAREKELGQFAWMEKIKVDLQKRTWKGALSATQGFLAVASNLMQSDRKKEFEFGKKAAIAQATIDMFKGIGNAWSYGPILGPIFAALVATAGMMNIRNIKSQQFQGGGGSGAAVPTYSADPNTGLPASGGGDAPSLPSSSSSSAAPRQVNISLQGEGMVSMTWLRDILIPGINEAVGDGVILRAS